MARAAKYPWAEWTDGEVHAVDYPFRPADRDQTKVDLSTLRNALRVYAHRKGLALRINKREPIDLRPAGYEGPPTPEFFRTRLMFQFKPRGRESEFALLDESRMFGKEVPTSVRLCGRCSGVAAPDGSCVRCGT